jgi:hypothetical protein
MGAIAALDEGKGTKTAIDYVSLVMPEAEKYMFDPLRAFKVWRSVSAQPLCSLISIVYVIYVACRRHCLVVAISAFWQCFDKCLDGLNGSRPRY